MQGIKQQILGAHPILSRRPLITAVGASKTIVIEGDAGMGKTKLLSEVQGLLLAAAAAAASRHSSAVCTPNASMAASNAGAAAAAAAAAAAVATATAGAAGGAAGAPTALAAAGNGAPAAAAAVATVGIAATGGACPPAPEGNGPSTSAGADGSAAAVVNGCFGPQIAAGGLQTAGGSPPSPSGAAGALGSGMALNVLAGTGSDGLGRLAPWRKVFRQLFAIDAQRAAQAAAAQAPLLAQIAVRALARLAQHAVPHTSPLGARLAAALHGYDAVWRPALAELLAIPSAELPRGELRGSGLAAAAGGGLRAATPAAAAAAPGGDPGASGAACAASDPRPSIHGAALAHSEPSGVGIEALSPSASALADPFAVEAGARLGASGSGDAGAPRAPRLAPLRVAPSSPQTGPLSAGSRFSPAGACSAGSAPGAGSPAAAAGALSLTRGGGASSKRANTWFAKVWEGFQSPASAFSPAAGFAASASVGKDGVQRAESEIDMGALRRGRLRSLDLPALFPRRSSVSGAYETVPALGRHSPGGEAPSPPSPSSPSDGRRAASVRFRTNVRLDARLSAGGARRLSAGAFPVCRAAPFVNA